MSYKVIADFNQGSTPETLTVTPYWVVSIWRQKYPLSYSRLLNGSFSPSISKGLEVYKPLIITDDCFQLSVSTTKNNHISNLSAGLYPTENYLQLINPGDWMCAWMVQSEKNFFDLIEKIKKGEACNKFNDGLKFFGKVNNIRKQIIQNPDGHRQSRYTMTGAGFSEFDAVLYYNPYLAARQDLLATQFGRFGYDINQFIDEKRGGITADLAIPQIIDVALGKGTPKNLGRNNNSADPKATYGTEGDSAYLLPMELGAVIGKTTTTKRGGMGYSDIVEVLVGIQEYDNIKSESGSDLTQVVRSFQPAGAQNSGSRRYTTNRDLLGAFLPTSPTFTNKTVWNVLREFLNMACNEMFATLRVNADGDVVPTVIVRQLPFSTEQSRLEIPHTSFLNVPRWEIESILIKNADIGRSDALRFNFVDVLPITSAAAARNPAAVSVTFPPVFDSIDIARSGLRPYQQTITSYAGETRNDSTKDWKALINDILMGQHMTMTGQITMVGIQAPICIGDNLEFDGVVYHIESLTHSCQISGDGQKTFSTIANLSHGINAIPVGGDLGVYAYTDQIGDDLNHNQYDPKTNSDSVVDRGTIERRSTLGDFNDPSSDTGELV